MKKQETIKRFLVFCEPCSYKRILTTDKPEDMAQIKVSPVPGGAPRLDPKTGKSVARPVQQQCAKVKCPQCGRGVVVKILPDVYSKSYQELDDKARKEQEEYDKKKRIEDGTPPKREKEPDFLG